MEKKVNYEEMYNALNEKFIAMSEYCFKIQSDVSSLKKTIGGYKTANEKYKKTNQELSARLAETEDSFHTAFKANNEAQERMKIEITGLKKQLAEETRRKEENERMMVFYKENYEHIKNAPWYDRLFGKF